MNKHSVIVYRSKTLDSISTDKDRFPYDNPEEFLKSKQDYLKNKYDYLKNRSRFSKYFESAELICDDENEETWKVVIDASLFICSIHGINEACKIKYLNTYEECKS